MSEMMTVRTGAEARQTMLPASRLTGLDVPDPPSFSFQFRTVFKKNVFLARKRKRPLSCLLPVAIWSAAAAGLYYAFVGQGEPSITSGILVAILEPLYLLFAVQGAMQTAVAEIVSEKESKMKVIQDVYGLTTQVYWSAWYSFYFLVSVVCVAIIHAMCYLVSPLFHNINPALTILVFLAAFTQQFELICMISTLFSTMRSATAFLSFFSWVMMASAAAMQGLLQGKAQITWWLASLLPSVNVYNTLAAMFWLKTGWNCDSGDCTQPGAGFANLFDSYVCLSPYNSFAPYSEDFVCQAYYEIFPAGYSLLIMLFDIALYAFLCWWLENVWQGEYGVAKPKCFCLMPTYLCPRRQPTTPQTEPDETSGSLEGRQGRPVAMSIRDLRKVFGKKVAVDGMSLNMYGQEVFALLGHNGAGKTTAINCIIGLIPPTSGGATVNGFDTNTDIERARRQLSICPQDNPLYPEFTVRQHLVFFASLRGVREAQVNERIDEVLSALGIQEKVDSLSSTLSGGQKRRLWVATALIGQSPIAFLDEPTSGMDPSSRRELWDLLLRMKATGRCIIFTTHYLEEADVLADRKAVLARGKVKAVGTSRELKMQFGIGYHLHMEISSQEGCDSKVKALVTKHISSAQMAAAEDMHGPANTNRRHLKFTLPYAEVPQFGPLLTELDDNKDALQVLDYSLAMTSLEEVFMALGRQAEQEIGGRDNTDFWEVESEQEVETYRAECSEKRSGLALARIRVLGTVTHRQSAYSTFILPVIFMVLSVSLSSGSLNSKHQDDSGAWSIAIYPPMAFGLSAIAFTMEIIVDREQKIKTVALAHGLSSKSYWLGTILAHYLLTLPVLLAFLFMLLVQTPPQLTGNAFPLLVPMVCVYPIGLLAFAYNFSSLFTTLELAVKFVPLCNMIAGTIPAALIFVFLGVLGQHDASWRNIAVMLHAAMCLINPVYNLPGMIIFLVFDPRADPDAGVVGHFLSWAAAPLFFFPVNMMMWGGHLVWRDSRSYTTTPGAFHDFGDGRKDDDVLAEERRMRETDGRVSPNEAVRYQNLNHTYKTKVNGTWTETHAVRGISLGIQKNECFGLLGPNGAGKTTTLAVLTGEVRPPTFGKVTIFDHDLASSSGLREAYQLLGFCPQVDPLWQRTSGREHLMFYGRIKGLPEHTLGQTVDRLLRRLGFDEADAKKKTATYSGGMKRKLSLGIALIGQSPLLFLDEPSAAVDAGAKRHLWKVIKMRAPGQTVVLTTHSMEEAEALCDRIAIQVNGQLRCLGSTSRVKSLYGSGYQLELFCSQALRVASGSFGAVPAEQILQFVQEKLSSEARLLEFHADRYLFQLPPIGCSGLTLGKVFVEVRSHMEELRIADYSVTQPSLEQVFLRFAQEQLDGSPEQAGDAMTARVEPQGSAAQRESLV